MNPSALCRLVREELAQHEIYITLPDYLDRLRVDKAKELFQSDPLIRCKEVASLVAFSSRSLRRIFKKYTGKTPTEYKM